MLTFNTTYNLDVSQMAKLEIQVRGNENFGFSKLPEYADSVFTWHIDYQRKCRNAYEGDETIEGVRHAYVVMRHRKSEVPAFDKTETLTTAGLISLQITADGFSKRPDLQDSRFTFVARNTGSDDSEWSVTRHKK